MPNWVNNKINVYGAGDLGKVVQRLEDAFGGDFYSADRFDGYASVFCRSAWKPPQELLSELAAENPDLTFVAHWIELENFQCGLAVLNARYDIDSCEIRDAGPQVFAGDGVKVYWGDDFDSALKRATSQTE